MMQAMARLPVRLAIFAFFFSLVLLFTSHRAPDGDGWGYFVLTDSLARHQSWSASPELSLGSGHDVSSPDGKRYTYFSSGQSLVQLPLYFLGIKLADAVSDDKARDFVVTLSLRATQAALTALAAVVLFGLLTGGLGHGPRLSLLVVGLYVLATQALPYSKMQYSEPLQALLLVMMASLTFGRITDRSLAGLAACCGALVVVKTVAVLFLPFFFAVFVYHVGRTEITRRRVLWALAAAAPFLVIFCYWNYLRTGNIWDYGRPPIVVASTKADLRLLPWSLLSLLGWPEKNIFLFNPILLLAVGGSFVAPNRHYRFFALGIFVLQAVVFGVFPMGFRLAQMGGTQGWGAWAWGPRYPMPFLILLSPLVAACLQRIGGVARRTWRIVAGVGAAVVSLVSIYVQILGASYSFMTVYQLCPVHERIREIVAKQAPPFPECQQDIRANAVVIHQYLLWHAIPDPSPGTLTPDFPWIDLPFRPPIAQGVFAAFPGHARAELFYPDFMFFSERQANPLRDWVQWPLVVVAGLSMAACIVAVVRPRAAA